MLYIGAAVAVVVVALIVLVAFAPTSPSSSSNKGTGPTSSDLTYSQAEPIAASSASGFDGGGWAVLFAAGLDSNASETYPINDTSLISSNCTVTPIGSSGSVTLPSTNVSRSAGEAPAWEFAFRNASDGIAIVTVLNGQGSVFGTISGQCADYFAFLSVIPSDVIDSSAAAAAVSVDASSFLSTYPTASALFGVVGGISFGIGHIGPEWSVEYSSCPLSPTATGMGEVFNATVNGTSGAVIFNQTTSESCSSSGTTSLSDSVQFGAVTTYTNFTNTTWVFNATTVANDIAWDDFTVGIESTGGVPVTSGWTATATNESGGVIATYNSTTNTWSSPGGATPLVLYDHLVISGSAALGGAASLVLTGVGTFGGTETSGLP